MKVKKRECMRSSKSFSCIWCFFLYVYRSYFHLNSSSKSIYQPKMCICFVWQTTIARSWIWSTLWIFTFCLQWIRMDSSALARGSARERTSCLVEQIPTEKISTEISLLGMIWWLWNETIELSSFWFCETLSADSSISEFPQAKNRFGFLPSS